MVTWKEFAAADPDLAETGRALLFQFGVGLAFLATVRKDGSPRLHPLCPIFSNDRLYVLITPASPKRYDLWRDGRFALQAFPQPKPGSDESHERFSDAFRWAVEQPSADILLAFDGDAAVGLTSVYADIQSLGFGPKCWLQDMVVDKERRSRGIGAQLMAAAETWARARGRTHIELSSNAGRVDAHRFYERHGFGRAYAFLKWLGH